MMRVRVVFAFHKGEEVSVTWSCKDYHIDDEDWYITLIDTSGQSFVKIKNYLFFEEV